MTYSGHIEIYEAEDGQTPIEVRLDRDTLWLSQAQMADLFGKDSDTIGQHLRNIYREGELDEVATTEESSVVRQEGKRQVRRTIRFHNLDAILSVGYRVNSKKGTQFRIWATRRLRELLVQVKRYDRIDVRRSGPLGGVRTVLAGTRTTLGGPQSEVQKRHGREQSDRFDEVHSPRRRIKRTNDDEREEAG